MSNDREGFHVGGLIAAGVVALFSLVVLFSSYYTVGQGERAVVTHYGAVGGVSDPGLHFKMPFVTGVTDISIQPQIEQYGSHDAPMQAYSQDQQPANIEVTVNFHVVDVVALYSGFGDIDTARARLIDPKVFEQVKNVFGGFNAQEAIQDRAKLNAKVADALRTAVGTRGPVVIDSVQIQDIAFSDTYEKAVEDRMQAQVREQQAVAEYHQRVTRADAAKYEVMAAADAEAHAITVKGQALRDNPGVPALILAQAAMRWDGHLPTTMPPNGTIPFLGLTK